MQNNWFNQWSSDGSFVGLYLVAFKSLQTGRTCGSVYLSTTRRINVHWSLPLILFWWLTFAVAGEVERLLREYTQNQEMVRNIGTHYYQIIYPVQLRQHKKMGISTREIGSSKVRKERSTVCHCTISSHYHPPHSALLNSERNKLQHHLCTFVMLLQS